MVTDVYDRRKERRAKPAWRRKEPPFSPDRLVLKGPAADAAAA
nr:hypothetical protein [Variovorax paradoxus]